MQDSLDHKLEQWRREMPKVDWTAEGIVTRIHVVGRELARHKRDSLRRHGLQLGQWQTLRDLRGLGKPYRATPSDLAARAGLSPAAMTKRLDGLVRAGYVHRQPDTVDRRKVTIELTAAGRAVWDRTMRDRGVREQELFAPLSQAQRTQLNDLLRRVIHALDTAT
jgi:DNA-binding MarR family transcriptional regulator